MEPRLLKMAFTIVEVFLRSRRGASLETILLGAGTLPEYPGNTGEKKMWNNFIDHV